MHKEAIQRARVRRGVIGCEQCGVEMKSTEKPSPFQVDHTIPASEPSKLIHSFDDFFERLFCPTSGLKVLCTACHYIKTQAENAQRTKPKKKAARRRRAR